MAIRETAIAKLQQLPEPLLEVVNDFIDFVIYRHQTPTAAVDSGETVEAWSRWFKAVDCLEVTPAATEPNYQEILFSKYRQQGLEL
ncbi:hypothetical protein K9N68_28405 [Kovacikia minuta CCNUW1]|uniref:hypothetical protein n=1 Tax=Kovacikia minuta TaxID=2931930 RepID=UPI001CCA36CC|nr:hypothetical protein [Kovacikia minuta]UBF25467.1 hypothetical protein K9N68_28405 [Kovacikia minuta CCNUW1]